MGKKASYAIALVAQLSTIVTIGRYDPSHSSPSILYPLWNEHRPGLVSWQLSQQVKVQIRISNGIHES